MRNKKIEVVQKTDGEKVPAKIIAQSIQEIAAGFKQIKNSRLNNHALVILLSHATKLPQYEVQKVLDALNDLEHLYLKK